MNPAAAFFAAIRAQPTADLPRLVYADWLDENGDPARATFIRRQCELAQPGHHDADGTAAREMRELLARHDEEWAARANELGLTWWFERGFLAVRMRAAAFIELAQTSQLPTDVMFVQLDEVQAHLNHLTPRDFTAVSLARNQLAATDLAVWTTNTAWFGLQALILSENQLDPNTAMWFKRTVHGRFEQLIRLDLALNPLADAGLKNFAVCDDLPALRELILYSTELTSKSMPDLAAGLLLPQLTYLDLSFNELGDAGLQALMRAPDLSNLRTLRLKSNYISTNGLDALLAAPTLTNLQHLELVRNRFDVPWRGLYCGGVALDTVVDPVIVERLRARWPNLVVW